MTESRTVSSREATRPPVMLDLFAGLGGASAAMRARGWNVVTVLERAG